MNLVLLPSFPLHRPTDPIMCLLSPKEQEAVQSPVFCPGCTLRNGLQRWGALAGKPVSRVEEDSGGCQGVVVWEWRWFCPTNANSLEMVIILRSAIPKMKLSHRVSGRSLLAGSRSQSLKPTERHLTWRAPCLQPLPRLSDHPLCPWPTMLTELVSLLFSPPLSIKNTLNTTCSSTETCLNHKCNHATPYRVL